MSNLIEDLSQFRKQIDEIDDKIINLLQERLKVVEEVGQYKEKNSQTKSFIRAGREATMLRDLTAKMGDKFPKAAIATIWRMIISSALATEQDMSISAYHTTQNNVCFWRAREYFGTFLKITKQESVDNVISDVATGVSAVGVLPLVDDSQNPWWVRPQEEKNDVYVFARIPFVENHDSKEPPAIAIANVAPEKTNNDTSILSVIGENAGAKDILQKFDLKIIAAHNNTNFLVEVNQFLSSDDSIINDIQNSLSNAQVRLMGSYATPISA